MNWLGFDKAGHALFTSNVFVDSKSAMLVSKVRTGGEI